MTTHRPMLLATLLPVLLAACGAEPPLRILALARTPALEPATPCAPGSWPARW